MKLEELAREVAKAEFNEFTSRFTNPITWDDLSPGEQKAHANDTANTLRALLAVLPSVGWQLVPDASGMTDDQAEAIAEHANCCGGIAYSIYQAALAAAPKLED